MLRLAHLSDLHHQIDWRKRPFWSSGWRGAPGRFELHALGRLGRFLGVEQRIARLVDQVLHLAPDRVIVTGDLTALGDRDELRRARALLEPFIAAGLLVVIPGNHDRYTDAGHTAFEVVFGDLLASDLPELADAQGYPFVKLVGEQHALVGLDSTRVQGWSHYVVGRLGARQLRALARVLEHPRLERRTVLLLAHHGPAGPSGTFDWNESGLIDAGALLHALRHRPVVLLHGHSHHRFWHRARPGRPDLIGGG
ncbi:MAG TPA: metallophosphoesterase, partial [Myxococcaceae bacterium]|nr:metallophosphoesterase [Myxococcaceae bacterium]